jgi:hypothetical protein
MISAEVKVESEKHPPSTSCLAAGCAEALEHKNKRFQALADMPGCPEVRFRSRRASFDHFAAALALSNIGVTLSPFDIFFTSLL